MLTNSISKQRVHSVPTARKVTKWQYRYKSIHCLHQIGNASHVLLLLYIQYQSSTPQSLITTFFEVLPFALPTASIAFTTSIPLVTFPNTTCFPSNQAVFTVHRKNCDPLVLGPALAIDSTPGPVCFSLKFSSANLLP